MKDNLTKTKPDDCATMLSGDIADKANLMLQNDKFYQKNPFAGQTP